MTLPAPSQKRVAFMAGLVLELTARDLTIPQAAEHLGMTQAGAKNYIRDLRGANLVTSVGHIRGTAGQPAPIWHLTSDKAAIDQYMAALREGKAPKRPIGPRATLLGQALKDPARHLHMLRDDTHYAPTIHRFKPFRDPLVTALFGAPGAHA